MPIRSYLMNPLLKEIRRNPVLWLLAFVPVVLIAQHVKPEAHTLLFVLSVLAIVPLAALLSHATESVAAKTGDTVGGLLNATLGNLTELVIALAALRAGQYTLVKASVAGAIVANTLFLLGASFLLGGLRHHVQEYNRINARLQTSLLFLATIAMLIPSAVSEADNMAVSAFTQQIKRGFVGAAHRRLRIGTAILAQDTSRDLWRRGPRGGRRSALADSFGSGDAGRRHVAGRTGERGFCRVRAAGGDSLRDDPRIRGFHRRGAGGRRSRDGFGVFRRWQKSDGFEREHRAGLRVPNRTLCRPDAGAPQLRYRPSPNGPAILARRGGHGAHFHGYRVPGYQQRALSVVCRGACNDGVSDFCHDALPVTTSNSVKARLTATTTPSRHVSAGRAQAMSSTAC